MVARSWGYHRMKKYKVLLINYRKQKIMTIATFDSREKAWEYITKDALERFKIDEKFYHANDVISEVKNKQYLKLGDHFVRYVIQETMPNG